MHCFSSDVMHFDAFVKRSAVITHHVSIPPSFILFLHLFYVLVKSFICSSLTSSEFSRKNNDFCAKVDFTDHQIRFLHITQNFLKWYLYLKNCYSLFGFTNILCKIFFLRVSKFFIRAIFLDQWNSILCCPIHIQNTGTL